MQVNDADDYAGLKPAEDASTCSPVTPQGTEEAREDLERCPRCGEDFWKCDCQ